MKILLYAVLVLSLVISPSISFAHHETINSQSIREAVIVAGRAYGVDPCLIAAIIKSESSFRPAAVSPRGAEGLMQLMPNTAANLGVRDSFNPTENILGGTKYLREMKDLFGSWRLAVVAYNWGPGNLVRYGVNQMPQETRDYLERVQRYYGQDLYIERKDNGKQ